MKKNVLIVILLLFVLVVCSTVMVACQNNVPDEPIDTPDNPDDPDDPNDPNDPDDPTPPQVDTHVHSHTRVTDGDTFVMKCSCDDVLDGYRIQFVYSEDGSEAEGGIAVTWIADDGSQHTATTDEFGYVTGTDLTEDEYKFTVEEDTLPVINGVTYKYNETKYSEQSNGIGLIIPLFGIHEPKNINDAGVNGRPTLERDLLDNLNYVNIDAIYKIDLDKTYAVTLNNAEDKVWYHVQNDGAGDYTVDGTMNDTVELTIDRHPASFATINPTPDSKVDKTQRNKLTYAVKNYEATQESTFCISAIAPSYPVQILFSVSITYVPDTDNVNEIFVTPTHFETEYCEHIYYTQVRGSNEYEEHTATSLRPVSGTQKCVDVEGSVIKDLTADQLLSMVLHDDGYYYTADNKLIYAKIATTSIFENLTLASYLNDSDPPSFSIYYVTSMDEYGYYTRRDNFFGFVQAYASLCNSDGLYPLTDEMYDYISIVAQNNQQSPESLLCTYPSQVNEWTVGNGTESSPYALTLGEDTYGNYRISISAGSKVYLSLSGDADITLTYNSNVKATIGSTPYNGEYATVNGTATVILETKDGSALEFVLKIDEYNDPYYLEVGSNEVFALPGAKVNYEFIATEAGSYDISISSATVNVTLKQSGHSDLAVDGTVTITVTAGESILFDIGTGMASQVDFLIIIENTPEN